MERTNTERSEEGRVSDTRRWISFGLVLANIQGGTKEQSIPDLTLDFNWN